jgi:protein-S-isoprenylcysteine O-methyltransferase Ste14
VFHVVPTLILDQIGADWTVLATRPRWVLVAASVALAPAAAMALQAVIELAHAGGTPFPLDPPKRLVTTGPYAYVANPMQLGGSILLAAWGGLVGSAVVVAAGAMAVVFSAGFAAWSEDAELSARFGEPWHEHRRSVRAWVPRWRPQVDTPGVVYVATSCEPCEEVGGFLAGRRAIGLTVSPATACPVPLRRITYERDGQRFSGIAAVGLSLEHVNLGWAALSWIGRLPGILTLIQLIADALGAGPRAVPVRPLRS